MRLFFKKFLTACSFLTCVPIPQKAILKNHEFYSSRDCFPLVGVFIGTLMLLLGVGLNEFVAPQVLCLLMVIFMVSISGAFHLDGLADTADGFLSSRPRKRMLEIMKDSQVGSMGVAVLVLTILAKVVVLECLYQNNQKLFLASLFLMPLAGRCSLIMGMFRMPYARDDGLGKLFWDPSLSRYIQTVIFLSAFCVFILGPQGIFVALALMLMNFTWAYCCTKKIGGGTGDTLGACCELSELFVVGVMCSL